jgi:15-cis-phytoene desaturase
VAARVAVLGGGVGGMTCAQELIERGFEVELFEMREAPGGKARSFPARGTATGGRPGWPAEHGFRHVANFYHHLPDTMRRIPGGGTGGATVYDNLVETTVSLLAQTRVPGQPLPQPSPPPLPALTTFPHTLGALEAMFADLTHRIGLRPGEAELFAARLWRVATSCRDRRFQDLEPQSWWDYIEADGRSRAYQDFLAQGMSSSLVAVRAREASARTIGQVIVQILAGVPGVADRDLVLDAPTSDSFLDPWYAYLIERGVRWNARTSVTSIACADGRINGASVRDEAGRSRAVTADFYVSALPLEVLAALVTPAMVQADPSLGNLAGLAAGDLGWMNGLQFYLKEDVRITNGYTLLVGSPWAVTVLSQPQFWKLDLADYGDGTVRGVLSAIVSEWGTPGLFVKEPAWSCSLEQIRQEVWQQMMYALNTGPVVLADDMLHGWTLDPAIVPIDGDGPVRYRNEEPLFINRPGRWDLRPPPVLAIPNLMLAADFVQTNTDFASMEAANEAARRAVNGILDATGSTAARCTIWPMDMPALLEPWRAHDRERFDQGLPWDGRLLD